MADILVGRGVRRRAPTIFDLIQGPATAAQSALGAMGSAAKGAAQATVGLPGDVESLVRMITGGEQTLPTTEQVGQFVNQYIRAPYPQYERLGEFTGLPVAGALNRPVTQLTNEAADALVRAITGNPQATAPQVIRETSMPFMQAVAPRTPGLLETPVKSELGFYSALEQATMPLQNKGTGAQFLAQIEKTAGVKPEEVKWTGLDEFLKSRQNVTKQEVQDYLAANRVNLQERRLAGDGGQSPVFAEYFPDTQKFHVFSNDLRLQGLYNTAEEADAFVKQYNASIPYGPSKFSKYTLPGGENYREILLTLPEGSKSPAYKAQKALDDANKAYDADQSYENYQKVLRAREEADKVGADWKSPEFRSSHFDQPNILAHMRVNDRVVDGKKTLFIEEIQSDWHQAGRKKGYAERNPLPVRVFDRNTGTEIGRFKSGKEAENFIAKEDPAMARLEYEEDFGRNIAGVPDAPFKTSWHELTLKRAIQEASEKGYDQIAFTTGKTQAERYDLSKQVKSVEWNPYQERGAERLVTIYPKDGNSIELPITKDGLVSSNAGTQFDGKPIDEVIGKDIAKQIMEQRSGELSGQGLAIGGEGMKGFYDQILPKSLEKLGKKFDAKVGKTEMDGVEVWQMDITPKMRESVLTKGQPLFAATPAVGLLGRDEEQ